MEKYTEVLDVMRKTREITLPSWGNVEVLNQKNTSAASAVTEIDEKVEKYLATEFLKIMPEVSYVGEEFGGDRTAKKFWLVDPVDATGCYIHGLPYCTTMVSLIEDNRVVFGAIYDFINDIMYHAILGHGAFANNATIQVSEREAGQAYLCYETKTEKPENIKKYVTVSDHYPLLIHVSAGYEYILVATGKLDGRIAHDPYGTDYDFAPGTLLVSEAGGVVTNIGSNSYSYSTPSHIAANKSVHSALTEGEKALFPIGK